MTDLGARLYTLRKEKGLTLEEVGNYVGVGRSTVRKWETGAIANMRRDKIKKLSEILSATPAYLMGWTDDPDDDGPSEGERPTKEQTAPSDDELMAAFFHGADPSLTEEDLAAMWQDAKNFRDFIIAKKMQEKK